MFIYKIGESYFNSLQNEDRNSGLYEYNLIKAEFSNNELLREKIFVIIGGFPTTKDFEEIHKIENIIERMQCSVKWKKVFIMTDSICFETCKEIYEDCDLVLHQVPKGGFPGMQRINLYGYMPELFFRDREVTDVKSNLVLFGGNNLNRQDEFTKYIYNSKGEVNDMILLLHKDYEHRADYRLPYEYYMRLLGLVKYSLVIARKEYYELGWVTSRVVEAYDNRVLPLVDLAYDKYCHFRISSYINCYDDIIKIINKNVYDWDYTQKMIDENVEEIRNNRKKFKEVVLNV